MFAPAPDRVPDLDEASLGTLFGRLVDDGKRLAKAEVAIQVATVRTRVDHSKAGLAMIGIAFLLVFAAVIVLVGALGAFLARWLGPAGGGALAALIALVLAGLLAKLGADRIGAAVTDPVA